MVLLGAMPLILGEVLGGLPYFLQELECPWHVPESIVCTGVGG